MPYSKRINVKLSFVFVTWQTTINWNHIKLQQSFKRVDFYPFQNGQPISVHQMLSQTLINEGISIHYWRYLQTGLWMHGYSLVYKVWQFYERCTVSGLSLIVVKITQNTFLHKIHFYSVKHGVNNLMIWSHKLLAQEALQALTGGSWCIISLCPIFCKEWEEFYLISAVWFRWQHLPWSSLSTAGEKSYAGGARYCTAGSTIVNNWSKSHYHGKTRNREFQNFAFHLF